MNVCKIIGLELVVAALNREIAKIEGRTQAGLIRASIVVQNDMEKTEPKTPVDTGNMRAGFFRVLSGGKIEEGRSPVFSDIGADGTVHPGAAEKASAIHSEVMAEVVAEASKDKYPAIYLGYSAYYAGWVHENMEAQHWSRKGSGPKWFQYALDRNTGEMLKKIREGARGK